MVLDPISANHNDYGAIQPTEQFIRNFIIDDQSPQQKPHSPKKKRQTNNEFDHARTSSAESDNVRVSSPESQRHTRTLSSDSNHLHALSSSPSTSSITSPSDGANKNLPKLNESPAGTLTARYHAGDGVEFVHNANGHAVMVRDTELGQQKKPLLGTAASDKSEAWIGNNNVYKMNKIFSKGKRPHYNQIEVAVDDLDDVRIADHVIVVNADDSDHNDDDSETYAKNGTNGNGGHDNNNQTGQASGGSGTNGFYSSRNPVTANSSSSGSVGPSTNHHAVVVSDGSDDHVKIDVPQTSNLTFKTAFPQERLKTFLASLLLLFSFTMTTLSLAVVHDRVPDRTIYKPLPDAFFDLIAENENALKISEYLIMINSNIAILTLIFHKHRFILFRRLFLMLTILYLMRSVTIFVTVLPVPSVKYYCSPQSPDRSIIHYVKRVIQLMSGLGLSINGQHTLCGDYIYSGHTVILVISYLLVAEYSPKKLVYVQWLIWLGSIMGVIMLLVAHGHYTIDVILAYYVTTRVFWTYHTLCNNQFLKRNSSSNYLGRAWWFPIFQYFEKNVNGVVPHKYNWPLPWPRRFASKHPSRTS